MASLSRVIEIRFHRDLGHPLLNEMRGRMEMCEWRRLMRAAKPDPEDSSTWNWEELERLDRSFNMVGMP